MSPKVPYWDRLFGQKHALLSFRGTLSGKTKQIREKRMIKIQDNLKIFSIYQSLTTTKIDHFLKTI